MSKHFEVWPSTRLNALGAATLANQRLGSASLLIINGTDRSDLSGQNERIVIVLKESIDGLEAQ